MTQDVEMAIVLLARDVMMGILMMGMDAQAIALFNMDINVIKTLIKEADASLNLH